MKKYLGFVKKFISFLFWIWIIIAPIIGSAALSFIFYINIPDTMGLLLVLFFMFGGILLSYILVKKAKKLGGPVNLLSRLLETPEIAPHDKR